MDGWTRSGNGGAASAGHCYCAWVEAGGIGKAKTEESPAHSGDPGLDGGCDWPDSALPAQQLSITLHSMADFAVAAMRDAKRL
nr:uncharacterized protein CTRU02_08815 [Colletotrichum truncatum]KAF6789567.1 hypothetical protein CTRU02_08815 [Colletotrichum truncatum]